MNASHPDKVIGHAPPVGSAADSRGDSDFLRVIGEKIRGYRARRGMTRKMLSESSGVSERYIAQLELGKGNISVLVLRKISQALGCSISEIFFDWEGHTPEAALTWEIIKSVPRESQRELRDLIVDTLGVDAAKQGRIALIGLRGAGKTTLGELLAAELGVPFIRIVSEIERKAGMSVSEIFSLSGQATYRRLELSALEDIIRNHPRAVIEAGGSLVSEARTFNRLLTSCFTIWVKATPQEHMGRVVSQGDFRPMENNRAAMADLKRILSERAPYYSQADIQLDTSGRSVAQSLEELGAVCNARAALRTA